MAEQPIRVAPGGKYGERKALREQQQGAPLPAEVRGAPNTQAARAALENPQRRPAPRAAVDPDGPIRDGGIFGATERPDEPMMQGVLDRILPDDDDELLRALYRKFPHRDELRRLLEARDRG